MVRVMDHVSSESRQGAGRALAPLVAAQRKPVSTPLPPLAAVGAQTGSGPAGVRVGLINLVVSGYGHRMLKLLGSYELTIRDVSQALHEASKSLNTAHKNQAATDALTAKILPAMISIGAAASVEPLLKGMTKISRLTTKAVEKLEDPLVALVQSAAGFLGPRKPAKGGHLGELPGMELNVRSMESFTFLNSSLSLLTRQRIKVHGTMSDTSLAVLEITLRNPNEVLRYDLGDLKRQLADVLAEVVAIAPTNTSLRQGKDLERVVERHLWAAWIRENYRSVDLWQEREEPAPVAWGPPRRWARIRPPYGPTKKWFHGFGTDIEDGINKAGVSALARVKLSGHWYRPNAPGDWEGRLLRWAEIYSEKITS